MNDLIVKHVNLFGDDIVAAQDNEGNIWAGVSGFCRGIGFSKSQKDTQVDKIQTDKTLKIGCRKFPAGVFDQNNETLALKLDFVPIWLAKISITSSMNESNPELADKLLQYQLKAKDVLADAFIKKPKSSAEMLLMYAQQFYEQEQRILAVENNLKEIEAKVTTHNDDYYTVAGYASLRGLKVDVNKANMLGRKASKLSREYGYDVAKTKDPRFGTVNMYHADILKEVFERVA